MAVNHRTKVLPSHYTRRKCRRCKTKDEEVMLLADRESRSGNLRQYTVGYYCGHCATVLIVELTAKGRGK